MALSWFKISLAMVMILLPIATRGDDPWTPSLNDICKEVECGKGTCQASLGYPFNFKCICDNGWRRTRLDNEETLEFLPCVIPNCSLDYSCMPAPAPLPSIPYNNSFFDPCYWIYCGGGTCIKDATYTHKCQCNSGYSNLNDISVFPCFNQCAVGSDCSRLGVKLSSSTSSSTSSRNNDDSPATSILPWKFQWMGILLISGAILLWK